MTAIHEISFSGRQVALVVRGKQSPEHAPGVLHQHADCILEDGAPVGFFGTGGPYSSASSPASVSNPVRRAGMNLQGYVAYHERMNRERPHYTDIEIARMNGVVSTVLVVPASTEQILRFRAYWFTLSKRPVGFFILGRNCSNQATNALLAAGLLSTDVPYLTTPDRLYRHLAAKHGSQASSHSGYLGFRRNGSRFTVQIEPCAAPTAMAAARA